MNKVQAHRGPDDSGVWVEGNAGLGHVRLSIIDLSPLAHQPMSNEDGTVWITFNGEIYNFPEIRDWLISKGHTLRSRSDTEVIVHLWEELGESCVERLAGMFAFAIWDARRGALFLARDRLGKKPLYYAALPDRLLFGSEIKAILQDPDFERRPDLIALHHYLAFQSVPSPYCAFEGIKKLPPAHTLLFEHGRTTLRRYWRLSYRDKLCCDSDLDTVDLEQQIIGRARDAVKCRLMSDVPLGAFLSGGIDSSIVVALMAEMSDKPVKTFSIGFNHEDYDELPYARMVAERYGTEHHEFVVTPDAEAVFPELVWHHDEPFADSSAVPSYYVSKMARQYVTVVLSGDGGDENFAGYNRYRNIRVGTWPSRLRFSALRLKDLWGSGGFPKPATFRREFARLQHLTPEKMQYYRRMTHFHEGSQEQLYSADFRKTLDGVQTLDLIMSKFGQSDATDFVDAMMDVDFSMYLPDTLMPKVDIASMTHSLEVRAPLLDHRFIEFVARIPSGLKLKDGIEGKHIFKKAVEPYLPDEVIHRRKMGFGVPIDHWFRTELREMVQDTLLSDSAIARGYFRREFVQGLLDRHQAGESLQYLIWNLLMLEVWHQMFIDGSVTPPSPLTPALP